MVSLNSLSDRQLQRYCKMFETGTQEHQEIKDILQIRRWTRMYGRNAAMEMYKSVLKMRRTFVPIDEREVIQLDLFS